MSCDLLFNWNFNVFVAEKKEKNECKSKATIMFFVKYNTKNSSMVIYSA